MSSLKRSSRLGALSSVARSPLFIAIGAAAFVVACAETMAPVAETPSTPTLEGLAPGQIMANASPQIEAAFLAKWLECEGLQSNATNLNAASLAFEQCSVAASFDDPACGCFEDAALLALVGELVPGAGPIEVLPRDGRDVGFPSGSSSGGSSGGTSGGTSGGSTSGGSTSGGSTSGGSDKPNCGPGDGGEGAPGETDPGDVDPGRSGEHNRAPNEPGDRGKGNRTELSPDEILLTNVDC